MADFRKETGNSTKGVELIAVIRPGHEAQKDGKVISKYAAVMVNNTALTKKDIAEGKGQGQPNLYAKKNGVDKDGKTLYNNDIRFSADQLAAIEKAGEGKSYTDEKGVKFVPFKADLMALRMEVTDKEGNKQKEMVGYMPNTKTLEPSELPKLTEARIKKQFDNTKEINKVASAKKDSKLAEAASKAKGEAETEAEVTKDPDCPF